VTRYRALVGLNYRPHGDPKRDEVRREPGDLLADLPPRADVASLLAQGLVEVAEDDAPEEDDRG